MEALIRIILLIILSYPGTFIIWLFKRKHCTFEEVRRNGSPYFHAVIICCLTGIIVLVIRWLLRE